jgi:hypothetical protein
MNYVLRLGCISMLAALATACSNGNDATPATAGVANTHLLSTSVARRPILPHPDRRPSWISPQLKQLTASVLFVSDAGTADVYIYKLPTLELMATITGFLQPQGECPDGSGDVWVTDAGGQTVYELTHRGQLLNEITDSSTPVGCAWDPTTGDLAVMDLFGSGTTAGNVLVYAKGTGSPKTYRNPKQYYYNFGGYDASGNLFFDGRNGSGRFILSELPKGANVARTITLSGGTIYFPGMVEWNRQTKRLIVGDQSCGNTDASCVYSVKIAGDRGTIDGKTALDNYAEDPLCDMVQGAVYGNEIAGSDYDFCDSNTSATYVWPYPAGGEPMSFNDTVDATPVGAAISK